MFMFSCSILLHDVGPNVGFESRSRNTVAQNFPAGPLRKLVTEVLNDSKASALLLLSFASFCFSSTIWPPHSKPGCFFVIRRRARQLPRSSPSSGLSARRLGINAKD